MNLNLSHKVILVTGGVKGIEGINQFLAAESVIPVIIGRNDTDIQQIKGSSSKRILLANSEMVLKRRTYSVGLNIYCEPAEIGMKPLRKWTLYPTTIHQI